jgi:hypothetical protein
VRGVARFVGEPQLRRDTPAGEQRLGMGGAIRRLGEQRHRFLEGSVGLLQMALAFIDPRDLHQRGGDALGLSFLPEFRQGQVVVRQRLREMFLLIMDRPDAKQFMA